MSFADTLRAEGRLTLTENGATAIRTTGDGLLDFFGSAGSLREADMSRVERLFANAIAEDKLLAARAMFYLRDIRGGLGERDTFRTCLRYAAHHYPELIAQNIPLIGEYGRFDDLYELAGTPLETAMWAYVKAQLDADEKAMLENQPCSLLAKWLKTADASSPRTRQIGIATAQHLGLSVYDYKRKLRALRKYIDVTEVKMSAKQWGDIKYETVPSQAMFKHRKAFDRNDQARYDEYLQKVASGEAVIHADTLFPYDVIGAYLGNQHNLRGCMLDPALEAQWKALPDYVGRDANCLVMADTSGSMDGRPLHSALGLAIYFAQRNHGAYHNLWMSFSRTAHIHELQGNTLFDQIRSIDMSDWDSNTDLECAFQRILEIAVKNHVPQDEMIRSLIIISDMEIDACNRSDHQLFYDEMSTRFAAAGYEIPNIVFWNVNSRHDIFHADKNRKGVQLCSGQSAATFRQLMQSVGMTPTEMMLSVLNSERYAPITLAA